MNRKHIDCGCGSKPQSGGKCTRICEPVKVMQGEAWKLAQSTDWNALCVDIPATGASVFVLPLNTSRKETIIRVLTTSTTDGWVFVGPTKADVEAGKGHPMRCGEVFIPEGWGGAVYIASTSGMSATVAVNELSF